MTTALVLSLLGNTEIKVTRFLKGRLVGGKLKASKSRPFKTLVSVQPVSGREREFLPEGWRQRYIVKIYSKVPLLASDDKATTKADLIEIDGEVFEVMSVETQRGLGLDHFKVYAARLNS